MTEQVRSLREISSTYFCYFALKQFCMYVDLTGAFDLGEAPPAGGCELSAHVPLDFYERVNVSGPSKPAFFFSLFSQ